MKEPLIPTNRSPSAPPTASWLLGSAVSGALLWLLLMALYHPSPWQTTWAVLLLLLAALVLVPLTLHLSGQHPQRQDPGLLKLAISWLQPLAALLLVISFSLDQGPLAGLLSLPWLIVTGLIALLGLSDLLWRPWKSVLFLAWDVGLIYLVIGGGWTVLNRFSVQPLDFNPIIVLLTGIHFHYAGFLLPVLTALAAEQLPRQRWLPCFTALGVCLSVPLVAMGITATQLGLSPLIETCAACSMALFGLLTASLYLQLAWTVPVDWKVRGLWFCTGLALAGGMFLAALYGLRPFLELAWLDIPWMRATHGTLNALGFGLVGLLSWICFPQQKTLLRSE